MIELSYGLRAVALGFGVFFLCNLFVGLFCAAIARSLGFERMEVRQAARLALALRLLPSAVAVSVTMVALFRGFLTFERQLGPELVSGWILLLASAGFVAWSESLIRGFGALWHSLRWNATDIVETPELFLAVAGFWRPRIIASRGFLETIPGPERSIALRHELAHFESRDNWKRLFLLLTPRLIPFFRFGFRQLESTWMRFAERTADDAAVAGDPSRAVLLAEILVRTARSRCGAASPFLASALIGSPGELGARVERLLSESAAESQRCAWPSYLSAALVLMPVFVAVFLPAKPLFELAERFLLHR